MENPIWQPNIKMEAIPELFTPSNLLPEAMPHLSLGNLSLKAYAKFYLIPSSNGTKEIDELTSELMNGQCLFNYVESTWPKYANYEEDTEVEWEIATLLQQVEWMLSELDGMDISDPLTDAQKTLISEYRARLCVYIHMACLQILIGCRGKTCIRLVGLRVLARIFRWRRRWKCFGVLRLGLLFYLGVCGRLFYDTCQFLRMRAYR